MLHSLALFVSLSGNATAGPLLQPLIEIAPVSEVVADGTTQAHIYVIGVFKDGEPIDGMVLKASTRTGRVGTLEPAGPGIYHFTYIPPRVEEPTEATLTVRGKTPDKRVVNISETVQLLPGDPFTMTSSSTLSEMVLGRDSVSTVSFEQSTRVGDIAARASAGELKGLTGYGEGSHKLEYHAARSSDPYLGIITAVAESGHSTTLGYHVIPQLAPATQDLEGEPSSHGVVSLGSREYGPVPLSDKGTARISLELTPGITAGTLTTGREHSSTSTPFEVELNETRHILLFPIPASIPADPNLKLKARVLVLDPAGQPDGNAKPTLTASRGEVNKPVHIRDGIYEVEYTPSAEPGPVTLSAGLGNDIQSDSLSTELLPLREGLEATISDNPVRHVVLIPEGTQVRSDGVSEMPLRVLTVDGYGQPVPDVEVNLTVRTGGGTIPESVTTDAQGMATVHYLSGREEFLVRIDAQRGAVTGATSFVQSPGPVNWNGVPIGGQEILQGIETAWSEAIHLALTPPSDDAETSP